MPRTSTSPADLRKRAQSIARKLQTAMPEAKVELSHRSPWELLVATILSAQCTDQRVNQVTPVLFKRYKTPAELAKARLPELELIIRSTGFFKNKAKNLTACANAVSTQFGGRVPDRMDDLVTLPGVGRKTANVLLGQAFGQPAIVVDTHVKRVSNRLRLTTSDDPVTIEEDLQQLVPSSQWTALSQRLLLHGRYVCVARKPLCSRCPIYDDCDAREKTPR
ncbi:MAG TPA: endonuclease III [Nitrospira sp.]|nr:endonuclease III [Nitrospira sp.]